MPMIECTLIKGYDKDTRQLLAERMTDAASATIGAHPDLVIVTIKEVDGDNYMRGRINRNPAPAPIHPEEIVKRFLTAMENRDLDEARSFLDEQFEMIFPGGQKFTALEELVDWAKSRYQKIGKRFDGFDTALNGREAVVTCYGYLHGVWPDGTTFDEIRFMDRFTISCGKITSQMVWNDLAEVQRAKN